MIVQNVLAPAEDRTDDAEDSFFEELEHVFPKGLHKNFVMRFHCQNRWKRYFQTDRCEGELT
jgi:hypothetical protein